MLLVDMGWRLSDSLQGHNIQIYLATIPMLEIQARSLPQGVGEPGDEHHALTHGAEQNVGMSWAIRTGADRTLLLQVLSRE